MDGTSDIGMTDTTAKMHEFAVGHFRCAAVSDGHLTYAPPEFPPPADMLFMDAPQDELARALAAHGVESREWKSWTSPYTCLLVDTGDSRLLIDTGAGRFGPTTGRLVENLESLGVHAGQIDRVVLSHGHPDHLGGNTDSDGKVVFGNAGWVMAKAEWEFWMGRGAEMMLPEHSRDMLVECARRNLQPIKERMRLVAGTEEIERGIRVVPARGHTPGHITVWISSQQEQLVVVSDLVLHPIHVEEPAWVVGSDMWPDRVAAERRALFSEASTGGCRMMAFHLPFPGLGRIVSKGRGWRWEAAG